MENWLNVAFLIMALVVAGVLIYIYKRGKLPSEEVSSIAELVDHLADVLGSLIGGESLITLLAQYAAKAVRVVEQMVKNGELEKDDTIRKTEARVIVEQLAIADGLDAELICSKEHVINTLIEAAVNEMQSPMVVSNQSQC